MKIDITRIEPAQGDTPASEIVATFDALVGDFVILGGTLRRKRDDGSFVVAAGGGRGHRGGIVLSRDGATRKKLIAAAVEAYKNV